MAPPHYGSGPPHPLALFSLKPYDNNQNAINALTDPLNKSLVRIDSDGVLALDIDFQIPSKSNAILATIGRNETDICLQKPSISKLHCSFEVDAEINVVMFLDRSSHGTTQVYSDGSDGSVRIPFVPGCKRQVIVQKSVNTIIGIGGTRADLYLFKLEWHCEPNDAMDMVKNHRENFRGHVAPQRLAQTVLDECDTEAPSGPQTRLQTKTIPAKIRYVEDPRSLGSGNFGTVIKVVNADTGKLMAMKKMRQHVDSFGRVDCTSSLHVKIRQEARYLSSLNHAHIVNYIGSQGWDEPEVKIFMGLKSGNLEKLVEEGQSVNPQHVFHHMLQALDYLATKGIIHRDVKPANILWMPSPDGQRQYQLADFGLSNYAVSAVTFSGSPLYMPPEFFNDREQTHKVDVWSLFVTMLWTLDICGFRNGVMQYHTTQQVTEFILRVAANEQVVAKIKETAAVNPDQRASAAQMLVKCFEGKGLSTPFDLVEGFEGRFAVATRAASTPSGLSVTTPRYPSGRTEPWGTAAARYQLRQRN